MIYKKLVYLFLVLLAFLFVLNYNYLDKKFTDWIAESEKAKVVKIIDGDTLVLEDGRHVRLLGVNTPEKGERYSNEAKKFTEKNLLNKPISLEFGKEKIDLYNRTLAYIILDGENFNKKLIEKGFANFYFPSGKDQKYSDFKKAWENCVSKGLNLCEKSQTREAQCIVLRNLYVKNQTVVFENICFYDVNLKNWDIKDEGRKHFLFPDFSAKARSQFQIAVGSGKNTDEKIHWDREDYVWTASGDTLFLRDAERKLVLWENY